MSLIDQVGNIASIGITAKVVTDIYGKKRNALIICRKRRKAKKRKR